MLALLFTASTTAHVVSPILPIDASLFKSVNVEPPEISPRLPIIADSLGEPSVPPRRPHVSIPVPKPIIVSVKPATPVVSGRFLYDPNVSWYGPGFYGNRTACGYALTKRLIGVAHKTLPCNTKVAFKWKGKIVIAKVVDRGPYVAGRQWDLTGGLCLALDHCFTGSIYYRIIR